MDTKPLIRYSEQSYQDGEYVLVREGGVVRVGVVTNVDKAGGLSWWKYDILLVVTKVQVTRFATDIRRFWVQEGDLLRHRINGAKLMFCKLEWSRKETALMAKISPKKKDGYSGIVDISYLHLMNNYELHGER